MARYVPQAEGDEIVTSTTGPTISKRPPQRYGVLCVPRAYRVRLMVEGYEGCEEMCYPYQVVLVEVVR